MRSPGVIYRRYRQIKRKYLYEAVIEARKRRHNNCAYGFSIIYTEDCVDKKVKLCTYGSASETDCANYANGLDICTCPKDCVAFASKWDKKSIVEEFERELLNLNIKRKKFPELEAYEWVLEKSLTEAEKNPSFIGKFIVACIKMLEELLIFINGPRKKLG